jgi:hypothetical protein
MTRFYSFQQNNSGGYYAVDDTVAEVVIFEADSAEDANNRAEEKGVFDYGFCECCGERFGRQWSDEKGYKSVKAAVKEASWMRQDRQVRVHYKDGRVVQA